MKYAFMTFSTPKLNLTEVLAVATRYGYDGIEPRIDAGHSHGVEFSAPAARRTEIRHLAQDSGVAIACLATSCNFSNPDTHAAMVEQARGRIDLAGDVGCPRIRVFGGDFPSSLNREQAIDLLARGLSALAEHAAGRHVTICLETHDSWCDPRHVAAVLGKVNHPAIKANWDIMHPARYFLASMQETFTILQPFLGHVHVHDGTFQDEGRKLTFVAIGQGTIDHKTPLKLLKAMPYNGFISGEWIDWEPADIHLPRELAALKRLEAE